MTKTRSHYHYILSHQRLLLYALLIVSDPKPSEPTKVIQYCLICFHYKGVYQLWLPQFSYLIRNAQKILMSNMIAFKTRTLFGTLQKAHVW